MSIFSKSLSQLETADLQELLTDQAVENIRLEFKSEVPNKDETLKKLSSFANTFGGFLVVGAKAKSSDGRIEALPGVDVQAGYKQKVVDWCFGRSYPPLTVEISDPIPVPSVNAKVGYVIHAPESDVAPHFLNGRKGVWIRTDEFSSRFEAELANESELRHLFDRRKLIRERRIGLLERARKRFDTYTARTHTDVAGNRTPLGPCLEVCVVPRFPARSLCDQEKLAQHIQKSWMDWRQVMFPDPGSPTLTQHESAIVLAASRGVSIFEVNVWGMLFYATKVEEDHHLATGIHLSEVVGYLLLFIRHSGTMLQSLGYSGPIHIEITLNSLLNAQWLLPQQGAWFSTRPGSELDDTVAFSVATTSDLLRDDPHSVVADLLRYLFFAVNWSGLVDSQEKIGQLVAAGRKYNFWP